MYAQKEEKLKKMSSVPNPIRNKAVVPSPFSGINYVGYLRKYGNFHCEHNWNGGIICIVLWIILK
jgi:hypothetical protein